MGTAGLLLGMTEDILGHVLIESIAVLLLALLGALCITFGPFRNLVYIYKLLATLAFVLCGGYMLLAMLLLLLANATDWSIMERQRKVKSPVSISLIFIIYTIYTLSLLGTAVSSNALLRAMDAHEEIVQLIQYTAPES